MPEAITDPISPVSPRTTGNSTGGGNTLCQCSCNGGPGSGSKDYNGSALGSRPGNRSSGNNSTDGPVQAAGYELRASDAGGLVTIAGLGVVLTLFM